MKSNQSNILRQKVWELENAIESKNVRRIKFLVNHIGEIDAYMFREAIRTHDFEVVKCFFEAGANPNLMNGNEPVFFSAVRSCSVEIIKLFLHYGVDINKKDDRDRNALMDAAESRDVEVVNLLLENGADPNLVSDGFYYTMSALTHAVERNDINILKTLLKANLNYRVKSSAILIAVKNNNYQMAELILDTGIRLNEDCIDKKLLGEIFEDAINKADVEKLKFIVNNGAKLNEEYSWIQTPLIRACERKEQKLVELLLELGADPNFMCECGSLPLKAAMRISDGNMIRLLIKKGANINVGGYELLLRVKDKENAQIFLDNGADVNGRDYDGETALIHAVERNDIECVKLLLDSGANINARDRDDRTAVMYAKNCEMLKVLCDAGADLALWDKNGQTPLMFLIERVVDSFEKKLELIRILIDAGADVNMKNNIGSNLLMYLVENNSEEYIKPIIKLGADINATNLLGKNALMYAADKCDLKTVKLLLDKGAKVNINQKDSNGVTALMYACRAYKEIDVAKLLIKYGADVNVQDNMGTTVLMLAVKNWKPLELVELLVKAGADKEKKDVYGVNAYKYADYARRDDILELLRV